MRVQGAAARVIERREVAERLRQFERPEGKRLARNRDVLPRRRGQDEEDAGVRSTLVQLPGRVQIARSIAEHRRRTRPVANGATKRLELVEQLTVGAKVREEREVVALAEQCEERLRRTRVEVLPRGGADGERRAVE